MEERKLTSVTEVLTFPTETSNIEECKVHKYHWPPYLITEIHHIWPRGMGGPDVKENRIGTCATGHTNIHKIIRWMIRLDRQDTGGLTDESLPKVSMIPYGTRKERQLALAGVKAWIDHGRPGRPE